jgi:hypothetical protein
MPAILAPVFKLPEALVTLPKSHMQGIEAQAVLRPVHGLAIDSSVTHIRSKIDRLVGVSSAGKLGDFAGTPFPFAPKWQPVNDISCKFALNDAFDLFAGSTFTNNSRTNSGIGSPAALTIDGFTPPDLRAGVETSDGKYRFTLRARMSPTTIVGRAPSSGSTRSRVSSRRRRPMGLACRAVSGGRNEEEKRDVQGHMPNPAQAGHDARGFHRSL